MKMRRFLLLLGLAFSLGRLSAASLHEQLEMARTDDDKLSQTEIIQRILKAEPNDRALRESLATLWISLDDYDQAERVVQDETLVSPAFRALVLAQVLYFRDNKKDEAIALLQAYHAKAPDDLAITRRLSEYLRNTEQYQPLVVLLDQAPGVSGDAPLLVTRAEARRSLRDFDGALRDFALAESLNRADKVVEDRRPSFERLREAQSHLKTLDAELAKNPSDVGALLARSYWYLFSGYAREAAATDAAAARQVEPDFVSGKLLFAFATYSYGQPGGDKALSELHVDAGKPLPAWDEFSAIYQKDVALKATPREVKLLAARGTALKEIQQYLLAVDDANAVTSLAPDNAPARVERIIALVKLKDYDAAGAEYRLLETSKPSAEQLASAASALSDAAFAESRFEVALDYATRAIKARPTPQLYKQRAAIYHRLNRGAEAHADLAKADAPTKKATTR